MVEDPALHDVERAGRLVRDDEPRAGRDGDRDEYPLSEPAGQLVRELPGPQLRVGHPGVGQLAAT